VLAVEPDVSQRTLDRDIAELTAKGAPIYGVDIDVLQFLSSDR
jgi:predicted DNA-binding transcriptional regulator YafY